MLSWQLDVHNCGQHKGNDDQFADEVEPPENVKRLADAESQMPLCHETIVDLDGNPNDKVFDPTDDLLIGLSLISNNLLKLS
eukprot:2503168-Amphidinium_carterae.1